MAFEILASITMTISPEETISYWRELHKTNKWINHACPVKMLNK
jgi:hypothetical protein